MQRDWLVVMGEALANAVLSPDMDIARVAVLLRIDKPGISYILEHG